MLPADLVGHKVSRAASWLRDAEAIFAVDLEEYLADVPRRDVAAFYLLLAIQECCDLAALWVSEQGWTPPDSVGAAFDVLAGHGAIPVAVATGMRRAVGLRHRIAHGYAAIDASRMHAEAPQGIAPIRAFLDAVSRAAEG